jgi:cytidine deaminase
MELTAKDIASYFSIIKAHLNDAYAPYSNFPVAALLLLKDGTYYTGINIENVSFGATNCAERTAIFTAINAQKRASDFQALFVIANTPAPIAPCSICRQVFVELFDQTMPVYLANSEQKYVRLSVEELVPYAFTNLETSE